MSRPRLHLLDGALQLINLLVGLFELIHVHFLHALLLADAEFLDVVNFLLEYLIFHLEFFNLLLGLLRVLLQVVDVLAHLLLVSDQLVVLLHQPVDLGQQARDFFVQALHLGLQQLGVASFLHSAVAVPRLLQVPVQVLHLLVLLQQIVFQELVG